MEVSVRLSGISNPTYTFVPTRYEAANHICHEQIDHSPAKNGSGELHIEDRRERRAE